MHFQWLNPDYPGVPLRKCFNRLTPYQTSYTNLTPHSLLGHFFGGPVFGPHSLTWISPLPSRPRLCPPCPVCPIYTLAGTIVLPSLVLSAKPYSCLPAPSVYFFLPAESSQGLALLSHTPSTGERGPALIKEGFEFHWASAAATSSLAGLAGQYPRGALLLSAQPGYDEATGSIGL